MLSDRFLRVCIVRRLADQKFLSAWKILRVGWAGGWLDGAFSCSPYLLQTERPFFLL